jgi:type I restriction enzyme, S subunit
MEVKNGNKQTEVGLIPEDWEVKTLESLTPSNVKYGIVDGPFGSNLKTEHYKKKGIPIVTSGFVTDGYFHAETYLYVDEAKFKQEKRSAVRGGDIVMAKIGARCGSSAILPLSHEESILSGNALKITIDNKNHSSVLIWYYLQSKYSKGDLDNITTTGAQPAISMSNLKLLLIPLPPTIEEQRAIATALSDVDELISSLDALLTKKKAIKQGAMQQLLTPPQKGGKRLPGFTGDWERITIEKVIKVARGGSPRPIQDYITTFSNGVNWIKIGDTSSKSKYITSSVEKIIPEGSQYSRNVNIGDFLLSNSMSFGRPYILKIDGCIHDGWLVLQEYSNSFDTEFLYYTLMSRDVYNQYLMKASGSSVLNLNKEIVKTVELNRPKDLNEQKAIAEILSEMDVEIEQLESKKAKYQSIKQGMMQELLTGKTRLV